MADVKLRMKLNSETPNEEYLDVDIYNGLKSVETTSQSTGQPKDIFYGSVESTGSATLLDINGDIEKKITNGELEKSNVPVTIIANGNTLFNHITYDSDYNRNSKTLNLKFGDKLNELDSMIFSGYIYQNEPKSLYDILLYVMQSLGYSENEVESMLQSNVFISNSDYPTIENYLKNISIPYPVIFSGNTYRKVLDEICTVAQLQLFVDKNDNFKFVSARPIMPLPKIYNAIKIPKKNMFSNLDYDLFITNKYDGVEIIKTDTTPKKETNIMVASEETNSNLTTYSTDGGTETVAPYAVICQVMASYKTVSITFNKKSLDNLTTITKVYSGVNNNDDPNIKYSIEYKHDEGGLIYESGAFGPHITSTTYGSGQLATFSTISTSVSGRGISATASVNDETNTKIAEIVDNGTYYSLTVTVLVGYQTRSGIWDTLNSEWVQEGEYNDFSMRPNTNITINIYGERITIPFDSISDKTSGYENAKTKVTIQGGNLLQIGTTYKSIPISTFIKENILSDYQDGISNATLDISASDYNTIENEKVKDWENSGEIIEIHDIVTTDSDVVNGVITRNWRVTGRTFRKNGVPMVNLELQEAKWSMVYGLLKTYNTFIGWNQLLENNYITVSDNSITGCDTTLLSGNLYIPNSITSIGRGGLRFSQLTAVNLPESITAIYQEAFRATKIKELLLPQTLTDVTLGICYQCEDLEKVILPYYAETIGNNAFLGCIKLNNVNIPLNVTTIYQNAFKDCSSLTSLTFDKTNGWGVREVNSQTVIPIDVSDPVTNAQMITGQYADYVWVNNE